MAAQTPSVERRYLREAAEWRASDTGPGTLYGYAAKFNTRSQDLGGFVETIAPGAFSKTIGEARVLCRYNHSDNHLLGTTIAGTLRLSVDEVGLAYEVDIPDTTVGRDVSVLAQRGDVRFSSFAFECVRDIWEFPETGPALRTLAEVKLMDVAPVNSPAYLDTSVAKRALEQRETLDAGGQLQPAADVTNGTGAPERVEPAPQDDRPSEGGTDAPAAPPDGHPAGVVDVLRGLIALDEVK